MGRVLKQNNGTLTVTLVRLKTLTLIPRETVKWFDFSAKPVNWPKGKDPLDLSDAQLNGIDLSSPRQGTRMNTLHRVQAYLTDSSFVNRDLSRSNFSGLIIHEVQWNLALARSEIQSIGFLRSRVRTILFQYCSSIDDIDASYQFRSVDYIRKNICTVLAHAFNQILLVGFSKQKRNSLQLRARSDWKMSNSSAASREGVTFFERKTKVKEKSRKTLPLRDCVVRERSCLESCHPSYRRTNEERSSGIFQSFPRGDLNSSVKEEHCEPYWNQVTRSSEKNGSKVSNKSRMNLSINSVPKRLLFRHTSFSDHLVNGNQRHCQRINHFSRIERRVSFTWVPRWLNTNKEYGP